jgi:hypothetical protein
MIETNQPRIEDALEIVDSEIEFATDERRAFRRFRQRLSAIDPAGPATTGAAMSDGATLTVASGTPSAGEGIRDVRRAYRETVMNTPHFETEYDESLRAHVAAELGTEVATQVVDGYRLTPVLREALETGSEQAAAERTEFLRVLEGERDSLAAIRATLDDCDRRLLDVGETLSEGPDTVTLGRLDDRLAAIERECQDLAEDRQRRLHHRSVGPYSGIEGQSIVTFLYAECEATCPGLAAIADCLSTVQTLRRRCLR